MSAVAVFRTPTAMSMSGSASAVRSRRDRFAAATAGEKQRQQTLRAPQPKHPCFHGGIRSIGMANVL